MDTSYHSPTIFGEKDQYVMKLKEERREIAREGLIPRTPS